MWESKDGKHCWKDNKREWFDSCSSCYLNEEAKANKQKQKHLISLTSLPDSGPTLSLCVNQRRAIASLHILHSEPK